MATFETFVYTNITLNFKLVGLYFWFVPLIQNSCANCGGYAYARQVFWRQLVTITTAKPRYFSCTPLAMDHIRVVISCFLSWSSWSLKIKEEDNF